jgi:hypothetical protein
VNDPITFVATTGTNLGGNALLPGGLTAGTTYYIQVGEATVYRGINGVENNFCLSTSSGGSKISWTSGFQGTVSSPGHTYGGTDIAFGTEKLVEAPAGGKSFQRGPNTAFSYGCCSTYMSHADVKKTVVIRPGDGGSAFTGGGYAKATVTNLNVSTLTVDLSTGNAFELDMDDIVLHQGTIGTFTITESIGSGKTQAFTLKVTQGAVARDFNWSTITNVKWPGSTPPAAMSTTNNAVDIYSFTTYDQGTTWYGRVVGQNFI